MDVLRIHTTKCHSSKKKCFLQIIKTRTKYLQALYDRNAAEERRLDEMYLICTHNKVVWPWFWIGIGRSKHV